MCFYHVTFLSKCVLIMWCSCLNVFLSYYILNVYYLHLIMLFCLVNVSFVDQLIYELFPSTVYCFPSIFNWSIIDESVEQMKQISNIFIIKYDPVIAWNKLVIYMERCNKIQQIIFDYIFFTFKTDHKIYFKNTVLVVWIMFTIILNHILTHKKP